MGSLCDQFRWYYEFSDAMYDFLNKNTQAGRGTCKFHFLLTSLEFLEELREVINSFAECGQHFLILFHILSLIFYSIFSVVIFSSRRDVCHSVDSAVLSSADYSDLDKHRQLFVLILSFGRVEI